MSTLHENMDELLFDYFEGNLSEEQMTEVNSMVSANPELAAEFEAWKNAFVPQEKEDYPLAHTLLAGSGAAWMRWTTLLLLIGLGTASLIYFLPNSNNGQNQTYSMKDKSGLKANNFTSDINHPAKQLISSKTSIEQNVDELNYYSKAGKQRGINSSVGEETEEKNSAKLDSKTGSLHVPNKSPLNDKNTEKKAQLKSGLNETIYKSGSFKESPEARAKANHGHSKTKQSALDQAMAYFDFGNGSSTNQYAVNSMPQPSGYLKSNSKKDRASSSRLLDKISRKIVFRLGQNLAFSNLKDPYFFYPNYYTPMAINPALTGNTEMLRMKITTHYNKMNDFGYSAQVDMPLGKTGLSFGINGDMNTIRLSENSKYDIKSIALSSSYKFKMGYFSNISVGANVGVREVFHQYDLLSYFSNEMFVSLGGHINTKYFYGGLGVNDLFAANSGEDKAFIMTRGFGINAYLGTDYLLRKNAKYVLSPQLNYQYSGLTHQLWIGSQMKMDWLLMGVSVNNYWDFAGNIGFIFRGNRIMYQYGDLNTDFFDRQQTHKLSIRLLLGKKGYSNDLPLVNE